MEIIRYVSEYDVALFNKRAINIVQLVSRSICDERNPDSKPETKQEQNKKNIPIKIIIPDIDKECKWNMKI